MAGVVMAEAALTAEVDLAVGLAVSAAEWAVDSAVAVRAEAGKT